MNSLTVKTRITIALTLLILTLMVITSSLGIGPNAKEQKMGKRVALAESVAISCSIYLNQNQLREIELMLKAIKGRNVELISSCIRRNTGQIETSIGDHGVLWSSSSKKSETHIEYPLQSGQASWGTVELLFLPFDPPGIAGWIRNGWVQFFLIVSSLTFSSFTFSSAMSLNSLILPTPFQNVFATHSIRLPKV